MSRIIKWLFLVLLGVLAGGAIIYNAFPQYILGALTVYYETQSGVSEKSISLGNYEQPYYEGGEGKTLILVHGFGDSKKSFVQLVKYVTPQFHVLLPDIPGFGDTARLATRNYSIRSDVDMLHKFVLKKKLSKFHLAGNSMGGHIAAAYALRHPEYVDKLVLLNAAGLLVKNNVPYKPSNSPLSNSEEFDAYMDKVFVKKPWVPKPFKAYFIEESRRNFDWMNTVRQQIREGDDYLLNKRVHLIQQPTLIIWGKQDQIVEFAVGEAYHRKIPNSKLHVFDPGGHAPQYEYPEKTAGVILEFLKE